MAETIVNFVMGKLTDVIVKEALLLHGVDGQVEMVSRELSRIRAFLKDADKKRITDERQKHWVKEVRDVAYSIEDVIDTFLAEIPQKPEKSAGMMNAMKRMIKKTKKIPAVHKLVDEIGQIQKRLKEIEESRLKYAINNLGEGNGEITLPVRPPVLPDIDPDVVGFKADLDHVVKVLLDETIKRRSVASIWGVPGIGKTTLAQKTYNNNNVKGRFDLRIWVTVSQKFELMDILTKMLKQLKEQLEQFVPPIDQSKDAEALLTKLYNSLRGKRYLIVLDDVWSSDLWTQIEVAFPDENNGSKVLLTTRSREVAMDADPTSEPHEVGFLTKDLSVELLLKRALPNQDTKDVSFDGFSDLTDQFVHKCGGLPLALVILGGLLAKKPCDYTAWCKVLQTMSWHTDGKKCSEIIAASYEDLPIALKSCFMYFAAFPEDYQIEVESLLQMWVAEGFIPEEDNRTLEETAESFLEDLVQRSMIRVLSRSSNGSIEYFLIHDLLRDLAIQKAIEDDFLMVYSDPDDKSSMSTTRRVAVHHPDCEELVLSRNVRTLLCFPKECMPDVSEQKLLKVVRCGESSIKKRKLVMFEELTQLRYLKLSGSLSEEREENFLAKAIGTMRFLQTLDMSELYSGKYGIKFPDSAWHINTLRHIFTRLFIMPLSLSLTNLQTLRAVGINLVSQQIELPHLPNLRKLDLWYVPSTLIVVVNLLNTLKHLTSLALSGSPSPLYIDMKGFPFYPYLQSLSLQLIDLDGRTSEITVHTNMFPPHITELTIRYHQFQEDPMPALGMLHCLKKLSLHNCTVRKMKTSVGSFCQLKKLVLNELTVLEDLEIGEGAMPILKDLYIRACDRLCVPQGLRHLINLQKLSWYMDNYKANEVRSLCEHVPQLYLGN